MAFFFKLKDAFIDFGKRNFCVIALLLFIVCNNVTFKIWVQNGLWIYKEDCIDKVLIFKIKLENLN